MVLVTLVFLVLGLVGLWIGADFLVRGTKNIAQHYGVPYFFIGLAFISIGTSVPEIAVSVAGGLDRLAGIETSGIVVGNKIGSALSQISLLFGILAFLIPMKLTRQAALRQGAFLIASVLIVFGLSYDGELSKADGWVAIILYALYYLFVWFEINSTKKEYVKAKIIPNVAIALMGLGLVIVTSEIVVSNGVMLAKMLGVGQSLIGVLLVGVGTGLPELSVAIASARRSAIGISMGDLIGSNICDLLFSLGAGTVISGFLVDPVLLWFDLPVLLFLSFLVVFFFYTERRISKWEGSFLILIFLVYAYLKIFVVG